MDPAFRAIPIFRRVKLTDRKSPMFANVYRRCFVHRKLSREANSPAEISITRFHDNTSHPATFPFTNSTRRHSLFLTPLRYRDFRLLPARSCSARLSSSASISTATNRSNFSSRAEEEKKKGKKYYSPVNGIDFEQTQAL